MKRWLVLAMPGLAVNSIVVLIVAGSLLPRARAGALTEAWGAAASVVLPVLAGAIAVGLVGGAPFALAVWLVTKAVPTWLSFELPQSRSRSPARHGVLGLLRIDAKFYLDAFRSYVRIDRSTDPYAWAGAMAMFSLGLLDVYGNAEGTVFAARAFLPRAADAASAALLSDAGTALANVAQSVAAAGVGIGATLAISAAVGLLLAGMPSRGAERVVATLVYVVSDVVSFAVLYHGAALTGWAAFRVSEGDVDRVATLNAIEVVYLVLGMLTTAGAPGITPANAFARLLVLAQVATIAVLVIWLGLSTQLHGSRSVAGDHGTTGVRSD